jgi:hypothetical protein
MEGRERRDDWVIVDCMKEDCCEWGDVRGFGRLVFNESDRQMESWSWIWREDEGREVDRDVRIEIAELTGPWGDVLIVELVL